MDLMKKEVRDELFNPQRPIYTKVRDDAPSRYGLTSNVKNSIIAQGCVINGEVENCVISKGVYVGEGAKLSNCICPDCSEKSPYIKLINADGVSDFTHKKVFLDENRAVCVVEYPFVNNTGLYKNPKRHQR